MCICFKKCYETIKKVIVLCLFMLSGTFAVRAQTAFDSLFGQAVRFARQCDLTRPAYCDSTLAYAFQALQLVESGAVPLRYASKVALYAFIGDIYHRQRNFEPAIQYLNRGIALADSGIGRNNNESSDCFYFLGLIEEYRQAYARALQYHQNCLEIRQGLHPSDTVRLVKSHQRLAACYGSIKDREREKQHLNYARWLCEKHPEISPSLYSSVMLDLVSNAANTGELEEAERLMEQLIANPALTPEQKSSAWYRLANIYHKQGALEPASKAYQRSIGIGESKNSADSRLAMPYTDWGVAEEQRGDSAAAMRCYRRALEISRHNYPYKHYSVGTGIYRMASLRFRFQDFKSALRDVQQALIELNPGFDSTDISANPPLDGSINYDYFRRSLWLKARILAKLAHQPGDNAFYLRQARATYRHCLALVERFRNDLPTIGARSSDLAEIRGMYEEAIAIESEAGAERDGRVPEFAFTANEKSKSVLLYAGIRENHAIQFAQIPEAMRGEEWSLKQRITQLEKERNAEAAKRKNNGDAAFMTLTGRLLDTRRAYDLLIKTIENQYPQYYQLKYERSTVSLPYVQDTLLQPNQALLEYFTGDSAIFIFLVTRDSFSVFEIKNDFPLDAWVKRLQNGLYGYYAADRAQQTPALKNTTLNDYLEASDSLYQKLLAPLAARLPGSLIIVPDGALGYVPFDALPEHRPANKYRYHEYPFFGKKHVINYCYSATLLREMRDKQHRRQPESEFTGFAPYYTGDTALLVNLFSDDAAMRKDLKPLPYSGEEVAAIAKLMDGKAYFGKDATEERFVAEAGKGRILHLATHGRADNRAGDDGWLAFNEIKDSVENELLYVRDLYNLSLVADLVVLSACETAVGKLQRGEGIISLARAFAYAGAKSIVTTLWSVNDRRTKDLMIRFYQNLKNGMPKDRALWKAKLDYIGKAGEDGAHPFFWAGFIGIGL